MLRFASGRSSSTAPRRTPHQPRRRHSICLPFASWIRHSATAPARSRSSQLLAFLPVPRDEVTNCAFGGDDLKTLYITAGGTLYSIRTATPGWVVWPKDK